MATTFSKKRLECRPLKATDLSDKPPLSFQGVRASDRTQRSATFSSDALHSIAAIICGVILPGLITFSAARADDSSPDLIFRESTRFRLMSPNDKLATYAIDDPHVDGVACYYTVPEKGGISGALGLAEQTSDVSLACRQYGAVKFKQKFEQGETAFVERRSLFFKHMQIVRGCDVKRNVLVYMVYTDKLIDGSPKNSTSTVPVQPWGGTGEIQKCGDFVK